MSEQKEMYTQMLNERVYEYTNGKTFNEIEILNEIKKIIVNLEKLEEGYLPQMDLELEEEEGASGK